MLEVLSAYIVKKIKEADPDGDADQEVLQYALEIKLNLCVTIILTLIFGLILGDVLGALLAFSGLAVSRKFSGGWHMKSLTACAVFSALLFAIIPTIHIDDKFSIILTGVCFVIFLIYSPNMFEDLNKSKLDPYLKIISLVIVSLNFIIVSPILALTFTAQAVSILPWKGGVRT